MSSRSRSTIALLAVIALACLCAIPAAHAQDGSIMPTSPVAKPTNFVEFVTYGCPAGLMTPENAAIADKYKKYYCCQYRSESNPKKVNRACGNDVLRVKGPATLDCATTRGSPKVQCCTAMNAAGEIMNRGLTCNTNNSASSLASTLVVTVLVGLVVAVGAL